MKIYRFRYRKKIMSGVLKEDVLFPIKGSVFKDFRLEDSAIPIGEVRLLPPVSPSKIVCIGRNYREHAEELGNAVPDEPLIFLKPPSAVIGNDQAIIYPEISQRVDYEGELAVVIKKKVKNLKEEEAWTDYVLGYSCFNDVTARDLQFKDIQFTRAKSFDTFAPFGPCLATDLNPEGLHLKTFLNGKLVQSGNTRNMIFSVPFLLCYVSGIMTLEPGDVIATGTPAGVGPLQPGGRIEVQIEGIGTLSNFVKK
ncbi:MAG TPA: fumarylacetoacetate hydrolase family protein [Candidatus Saccharicenans sp.]|jgi:2-keto-4-pentenoate hydratase/2-oxohepta-3-ene-1,7-dioic acid hydratase in catechol pathway|nr:fumarylacetoacetate hydrolase family protein [Candidatus Saccharicenans sp.]HRD01624.1 fumarylacetoacetate hydrolase family protein [Candidatus Saccharicenans sp.]